MKYIAPLSLVFLGLLIYSNVLYAPFIFDDLEYIETNEQIRDISNFFKDFSSTRYVTFLSFALNYYFGELNTFGYHLINIVIHILNAILVYFLVSLTFKALPLTSILSPEGRGKGEGELQTQSLIAFAVSLIFLVHPIQTQAVTYISQRFTSLATLFYLLSMVLYVKARINTMLNFKYLMLNNSKFKIKHLTLYFLSLFSAILAMKTKEISFTLPFIIALYEFTFFKQFKRLELFKRFLYLLPFFLTLAIIPLALLLPESMSDTMREKQLKDIANIPQHIYLFTQFKVIITYIRLLFSPANQTFWYDYPLSYSILEPAAFLSFIFLLMIFSFAVYLYFSSHKRHNIHGLLISFGILWFFITLSVESSIIPITDVIFEHRAYLPSVGFILSATAAVFYGFIYLEKKAKRALIYHLFFIILIISAVFSFLTYKRNIIWGDKFMMYIDNVKKSPGRSIVRYNLGNMYYNEGRLDEALNEYLTLTINPYNPYNANAHNNIGNIYVKKGRVDEAIKEYKSALRINPNHRDARYNLGNTYYNQGMFNEAISEYKTALTLNPKDANLYYTLGNVYASKNQFADAIKAYGSALKINPDYLDAHYNLGNAYFEQGQLEEAIKEYLSSLKLNPNDADAHNNLGFAFFKKGRLDDALKEYLFALKLKPDHFNAHYNLGLAYMKKGLKEDARKEFEMVLKLKPDFAEARKALEELK